jgi:hypothetical protein
LLSGRPQPLDRLLAVAVDGISVVVETAVMEDTEIELRRSLAALGGKSAGAS